MGKYNAVEHWAKIEVGGPWAGWWRCPCSVWFCGALHAGMCLQQHTSEMPCSSAAGWHLWVWVCHLQACRAVALPLQVPADAAELAAMQRRLAARYPTAAFAAARRRLDPKNVLGSPMVDALLPRGDAS